MTESLQPIVGKGKFDLAYYWTELIEKMKKMQTTHTYREIDTDIHKHTHTHHE